MSKSRKNFIPLNEGFLCEACGFLVQPANGTFRNHCPRCLASKHVDNTIPGDRASACGGLMPAVGYEGTDTAKLDIIHRCEKCGKTIRNRAAPDDDFQKIIKLNS